MNQIISQLYIFAIIGVLMFSLTLFLPAHANMIDNNTKNGLMEHHVMDNIINGYGMLMSPLEQFKHGTLPHDVKCKASFSLIIKASDGSPACVNPSSVKTLVARGWAKADSMDMIGHDMIQNKDVMSPQNIANKTMQDNMMSKDPPMLSQSATESQYPNAPGLIGISDYINTTPASLAQEMKDKIIVYQFWTFNCINCIHTLPHVVDLSNKYLGKGVVVIGIHSPETFFEKDPNNVLDAVHRYNIQYPVVTDNQFQTWNAFGNHYWPHIYIADAQGKIRYDHIGEGAYDEIDNTVASLLLEQENQKPKELAMG